MAQEISIKKFKTLALYTLFSRIPCFIASALVNEIRCYSFDARSMRTVIRSLDEAQTIKCPRKDNKNSRKKESQIPDSASIRSDFDDNRSTMLKNKTFKEVFDKLHRIRLDIPRGAKANQKKDAIKAIEKAISRLKHLHIKPEEGFLKNLWYYALWLEVQLSNSKLKIKSFNTEASGIEFKFLYMLGPVAIDSMSSGQLKEVTTKTFILYRSSGIRTSVKVFTEALYDYQDNIFPPMSWEQLLWGTDRELWKENSQTTKPLITFKQIRVALEKALKCTKIDPLKIRVTLILGFFAGLRISEILHLDDKSLIYDGGYVLRIRTSKSASGIRNIPLSLLLPKAYLNELVDFFKKAEKLKYIDSPGREPFLIFTDKEPFKESIKYSNEIAAIFKTINPDVRFHHLRHNFASWFLIRWYVLLFDKDHIPEDSEFLTEEIFNKKYLSYLRVLLFGYGQSKIGQDSFSHVLLALARIMGHAGPTTTMNSYIHVFDWLYKLIVGSDETSLILKVNNSIIEDFMQCTYPSLPAHLKKRKTKEISLDILIAAQLTMLKQKIKHNDQRR
jgi:integrase